MCVDQDNLNMLKEIIGDDLKEVLDAFLSTSPSLLEQIERSIASEDAAGVQLHSHTLKGSSANIGATELPNLCLELETAAKAGVVTPEFSPMLANIKAETMNVTAALKDFLKTF
ncbi:Hpt domain-containing protein [Thiomicrorhabdus indica]|uniref:Hpt domain-containing protein n=1 Tax=Thiomicrorhabdus indica TaxID=2267253 RepID=UPI002AA6B6EC|nr:Hpt domain-containing protein [Thiomicrorhabdus indica]